MGYGTSVGPLTPRRPGIPGNQTLVVRHAWPPQRADPVDPGTADVHRGMLTDYARSRRLRQVAYWQLLCYVPHRRQAWRE